MDKLKKHINKNRAALDHIETPNMEKIWASIQSEMEEGRPSFKNNKQVKKWEQPGVINKKSRRFPLWTIASAAAIALLVGVGVGYLMKEEVATPIEFHLANYAPELESQEKVFRQLVAHKMEEIDVEHLDKEAFAEIFEELKQLDGEYKNWTKDVPKYVHERELIEFLTRHYEQKIRILEILSKEIEKKAHYEEREINL